jgi:2-oxoglutarate ferredoxin oxidoreductase subunit alpha
LRVRGFPFDARVEAFLNRHEVCFVVEQNRDAQLHSLLILETNVPKEKLRSVLVYGSFPLSARHVIAEITAQLDLATTHHRVTSPTPATPPVVGQLAEAE